MTMSNKDDVYEKVRAIIHEILKAPAEDITPEAKLVEDLAADSFSTTQLLMELEKKSGIEISDEEFPLFFTVQDVVDYVNSQLSIRDGMAPS
jgi:acyl carrier protein